MNAAFQSLAGSFVLPGSRRLRVLLAVVLGWLASQVGARAQSQDDVTVAFLYNFARFVDWPTPAFPSGDAPFVIGFVGRPALADKFAQAVQGKNVNGRELVIRKIDRLADLGSCHIAYVGDPSVVAGAVSVLQGKPILAVGDGDAFLALGGMIAFSRDGPRLVFDMNATAIAKAGMTPSDKLKKAARSNKGG